jgi:protein-tyrosine phosphatase
MSEPEVVIQGMSMGELVETRIPVMTEVAPLLWVGGAAGSVLPENIKHVVSMIGQVGYEVKHPLHSVLVVHWEDNLEQPLDQVDVLADWVNSCTGDLLVHCGAGLNRSCIVAARAMMRSGWTADTAIKDIREKRSEHCLTNPHFEEWLRDND